MDVFRLSYNNIYAYEIDNQNVAILLTYNSNDVKKLLKKCFSNEFYIDTAIVTKIHTNPLIQTVDFEKLKNLCNFYNIPIIIDSTFATPYNLDLNKYADICVESLTKFACGNADVLNGCDNFKQIFKISHISFVE
ncbi:MAG: PLP-dependent transferase [Aliarcobacter skirrowii]|uniref:PLP-dependent transferase n=1 Tax=Aliarcobacter skirrowii TaxID=28200 RepID=UPI00242D6905|nr:PLP-dependent transferase [Aliarcobacter skirrowii]MDD2508542.1 PLP-dependent transferase [Aliarcobacter skirrowii]MDD3026432.1 PLP-dependent transferase [Aliarcobacter skirrowii]MDD3497253.1 PLP-dependent transferase [Aliarcobacter skirrowii]